MPCWPLASSPSLLMHAWCASSVIDRSVRSITSRPRKPLAATRSRSLFRRILPNVLTPLIVQGTLGIATAILDAAAFSFLGLGAQPPTPEWGSMLGAERNQVFTAPHLVFYPGLGNYADRAFIQSSRRRLARCPRPAARPCQRVIKIEPTIIVRHAPRSSRGALFSKSWLIFSYHY